MVGLVSLLIIVFSVNTVSSQIVNTTQYNNFTIEWEDFNILICAVPTSVNISLFTCLPSAGYTQVADMDCLQETTVNFDQDVCEISTTVMMYTSSAAITTITTGLQTSTNMATSTSQSKTSVGITSQTAATVTGTSFTSTSTNIGTTHASNITNTGTTHTSTSTNTGTGFTSTSTNTGTGFTSTSSNTGTTHTSTSTNTGTGFTSTSTITGTGFTSTSTITGTGFTSNSTITGTGFTSTSTITGTGFTSTSTITGTGFASTSTTTGTTHTLTSTNTQTTHSSAATITTAIISHTNTTAVNGHGTMNITTSTSVSTMATATANMYTCPSAAYIGIYCNISSDACSMSQPCLNAATCFPNNTLPYGYYCNCQTGYTGYDCEYDSRPCTETTCWNNGTCITMNNTVATNNGSNFRCECVEGYDGIHCQLQIDLCGNITCENRGVCLTTDFMWKCVCLDSSLYYGDYCQFQTSKLMIREILSKSFASIAIAVISTTCAFIVIMDILKYCFRIDPVEYERESYRKRLAERRRARRQNKRKGPRFALRFQYVSTK